MNRYRHKAKSFMNSEYNKTLKADSIEDNDEYLKKYKTTIQDKINIIASFKDRAKIIPRYVATPLPPLNFSQIG